MIYAVLMAAAESSRLLLHRVSLLWIHRGLIVEVLLLVLQHVVCASLYVDEEGVRPGHILHL